MKYSIEHLSVTPRGIVKDGPFEDSLRVGADERAGTYLVRLEAEGYQPWDTSGIQVSRDECHVRTATFTAVLDPAQ